MASLLVGNKRKQVPLPEDHEDDPDYKTQAKRLQGMVIQNETTANGDGDGVRSLEVPEFIRPAVITPALTVSNVRLALPKVRVVVQTVIDSSGTVVSKPANGPLDILDDHMVFEARNSRNPAEREPARVVVTRKNQVVWIDYVPRAVLLAAGNSKFWAAACEDGTVHVWSPTGRRLLNTLVLEAAAVFLVCRSDWLLAVTSVGMAHVWNIKTLKIAHPPVSLAPILDVANHVQENGITRGPSVTDASINSKGLIIVSCNNGEGFFYNPDLMSWQRLTEAWWAVGSQYWDSTGSSTRMAIMDKPDTAAASVAAQVSAGIIPHLERKTTHEVLMAGRGRFLQRLFKNLLNREGFEGFETQVSIAHLENRMAGAIALGAKEEFRQYLMMYVRRIGAEGLKAKVEELCKELMGDMFDEDDENIEDEEDEDEMDTDGHDGRDRAEEDEVQDGGQICGWEKRELLKDVVVVLGKLTCPCGFGSNTNTVSQGSTGTFSALLSHMHACLVCWTAAAAAVPLMSMTSKSIPCGITSLSLDGLKWTSFLTTYTRYPRLSFSTFLSSSSCFHSHCIYQFPLVIPMSSF